MGKHVHLRTDCLLQRQAVKILFMEELVQTLIGKKIDINCSATTAFRGDVTNVSGGVVSVKCEDGTMSHIAIDKISAISEVNDSHSRPGFVS